jgi:hypothetical protein
MRRSVRLALLVEVYVKFPWMPGCVGVMAALFPSEWDQESVGLFHVLFPRLFGGEIVYAKVKPGGGFLVPARSITFRLFVKPATP